MAKRILSVFVVLSLLLPGACASIVNGTRQKVKIETEPVSADVVVIDKAGMKVCESETPCELKLQRGRGYFSPSEYTVRLDHEAYEPEQVRLKGNVSGWYFGNFILGGLIGLLGVDPATGGMWSLHPGKVKVDLKEVAHRDPAAVLPGAFDRPAEEAGIESSGHDAAPLAAGASIQGQAPPADDLPGVPPPTEN